MPPKSLLTAAASDAPPPFVVRAPEEDFSSKVLAHQQRIMQQPFLDRQVPHDVPEGRAQVLQELLNASTAPLAVTSKMSPAIPTQRLFEGCDVRSFVRSRPVVESLDKGMKPTDAVLVQKASGKKESVIFLPRMNATGTIVDALQVATDATFVGAKDDNDTVFEYFMPPLLQLAVAGGAVGILCFGMTGSGKTHTLFGLLRNTCRDLEPMLETHSIFLTVLEVQQASIVDLLSDTTVQIVEGDQGLTFSGAEEPELSRPDVMAKVIDVVENQRQRHPRSSAKNHLYIRLSIRNKRTAWAKPGCIVFVDLAGSEKAHDADTRHVSASFTALKDCIRIRAIQRANNTATEGSVPLRTTNLTFVLKDLLEVSNRATKLAMISCIAPSYTNLRHTSETLRMATLCCVHPSGEAAPPHPIIPQFSYQDCCDFLTRISFGRVKAAQVLPETLDGRQLLNKSEEQLISMLCEKPPPPLQVPARVARSIFNTIQAIGIATKTLGPSVKGAPVMGFGGIQRQQPQVSSRKLSTGNQETPVATPVAAPAPQIQQQPTPPTGPPLGIASNRGSLATPVASARGANALVSSARGGTATSGAVVPLPLIGKPKQIAVSRPL